MIALCDAPRLSLGWEESMWQYAPRLAFLQNVGRFGVPVFDMTDEELEQEIRNADPDQG